MIWYFLFTLIAVTLIIMASLILYKVRESRRNKQQLKLTNNWRTYFDDYFETEQTINLVMEESAFKRLHSIEELIAFFAGGAAYHHSPLLEEREQFRQLIRSNKKDWIQLGQTYRKKKLIEKAYFAYICEQLRINDPKEYDELTELMISFALEPSINSRENALKALFAFGNIEAVVEVFKRLSKTTHTHHRKLVTDGLLEFKGDQKALAESLYDNFGVFSANYQVAMIDFFRLSDAPLSDKLITLLKQGTEDKEVLCAVLRYYEKYPVQAYKETILSYLTQTFDENWECVSTAAAVLSKYPGEDTLQALKVALSSKYWYVRLNAARSIAELGVSEECVMDILDGQDAYAKEQLVYQMASTRERLVQNG